MREAKVNQQRKLLARVINLTLQDQVQIARVRVNSLWTSPMLSKPAFCLRVIIRSLTPNNLCTLFVCMCVCVCV